MLYFIELQIYVIRRLDEDKFDLFVGRRLCRLSFATGNMDFG